jgi:hypothetical protein
MESKYFVGLDLGQRHDFTALAVLERRERAVGGLDPVTYLQPSKTELVVRYLERMKLGTAYPQVLERVKRLVSQHPLKGNCTLLVDATGVGAPVVDWIKRSDLNCVMVPITITGGGRSVERSGGNYVTRTDLLSGVQVHLERQELILPDPMPELDRLIEELTALRIQTGARGRVRVDSESSATHDDLAIALALACWGAGRPGRSGWGTQGLGLEM